jgi:hypothetical protein
MLLSTASLTTTPGDVALSHNGYIAIVSVSSTVLIFAAAALVLYGLRIYRRRILNGYQAVGRNKATLYA